MGVHNPEESFQSLFDKKIKPKIAMKVSQEDAQNMTIENCYVGHAKNSLDITDPSLLVQEVVSIIGHYVKYREVQMQNIVYNQQDQFEMHLTF